MTKQFPPRYTKYKRRAPIKDDLAETAMGQNGLIVSNYGQALDVEDQTGAIHRCTIRKKIVNLVCGDKVFWLPASGDEGVIIALQPRRTLLVRPDNNGALKPVAANVDRLIVVIAPRPSGDSRNASEDDPAFDTCLIDRHLVAAELSRIPAMIVVNKIDLFSTEALARARLFMEIYQDIGYDVLFTSTKQSSGIAELTESFKGHISVFCGPSGVGKSSLVKIVLPDQDIRISEVSAASGAGRHTTTLTTLYRLAHGGALIDSPGVRDFGLWHVGTAQVARGFVEFQQYAADCRFADCSHLNEPGCAVQQAVQSEQLSAFRLASYRRIVASLQH
jgi:ribosome biogenesis GTPase / thiamine phosphate phosphatase